MGGKEERGKGKIGSGPPHLSERGCAPGHETSVHKVDMFVVFVFIKYAVLL